MPSKSRVRAGIELAGRTLRYAEVELRAGDFDTGQPGPPPGLVRMGACDFEFDVAAALLTADEPGHLDTVGQAIADIYRDSAAEQLCIAVHGWQSTSFFSPLPADVGAADKFDQLRQETGLLADIPPPRPLHLAVTPVRTETLADGRPYYWHHVLHLPEGAHARAAELGRRLGPAVTHRFVDAGGAAAAVAARSRQLDEAAGAVQTGGFTIVAGFYGAFAEISLAREGTWHFGHWFEASEPSDVAYFTAALIEQLAIELLEVEHLVVFGEPDDGGRIEAMESLLAIEARPLNPLSMFRSVRSEADPRLLAAFAPAVGAGLR